MAGAKSKSCKNSKPGKSSKSKSSTRGRKRGRSEDSPSPPPKRTKKASKASKAKSKASKTGKKGGKVNPSSSAPKKAKRATKTDKKTKKDCVCGGKRKKNPSRKKRPLNSFMRFCQEVRVRLTEKYPGISVTEVGRRAGKCWRALPENIKETYKQSACGKTNGECQRCPHCKQLWANAPK